MGFTVLLGGGGVYLRVRLHDFAKYYASVDTDHRTTTPVDFSGQKRMPNNEDCSIETYCVHLVYRFTISAFFSYTLNTLSIVKYEIIGEVITSLPELP